MYKVTKVEAKPNYTLALTFNDGSHGVISMAGRLFGEAFEPLKDPNYFAQVKVDKFGAVYWDNGVDLDPENLYMNLIRN